MKILLTISILFKCLLIFSQELSPQPEATYALVVGISDYQDEGIPDLRFADRDAEAFANFLRSPAGGALNANHLKILINEQATAAQFAIALDWLMEVVNENDRVIIYFSGHGDVEKKMITQDGYFLCWDAPARVYMAGGTLSLTMFQDVISTLSVQNKAKVIIISDACRSGKLSGNSVGGVQLTNANFAKQHANEIKILSCQPNEYSIEGEQWGGGRGAFSYHLLEGLYGLADGNNDLSINLKEIDRYLEDYVSVEVAPHKQNPITIGSKTERLTTVLPEILEEIVEGRKGQMQLFTTTDSRAIEDEVLEQSDSNIVEMYLAFKHSLQEKHFLCAPLGQLENACADFYYERLSKEPQLERLHSTMRRNYAAALQDDTQQELNLMLTTGLTEQIITGRTNASLYNNYPQYLERAADLLGKEHYMYDLLQARKFYFIGKLKNNYKEKRNAFFEALKWQADMPHTLLEISNTYYIQDSAEIFALKAAALVPSWASPYISLASNHLWYENKKAKSWLEKATQIDSGSVELWYLKGCYSMWHYDFTTAEYCFLKAIENIPPNLSFPTIYYALGNLFLLKNQPAKAESQFKQCLQLDDKFFVAYEALGEVYLLKNQRKEAEQVYKKAIQIARTNNDEEIDFGYLRHLSRAIGSNSVEAWVDDPEFNLWEFYVRLDRSSEADQQLKTVLAQKSIEPTVYYRIGEIYYLEGKERKAEEYFQKFHDLIPGENRLSWFFLIHGEFEKSKYYIEQRRAFYAEDPSKSLYDLAWLHYSFGKRKEAMELLNDFVEKQGLYDLGVIGHRIMFSASVEPTEKAKANFEAYIPTNPKIMEVWDCLQLMKKKQYKEAEQTYNSLVNDVIEWWIKRYLRLNFVIMKIKQGEYHTAIDIMDACRMDHYTFNYPLLTRDTDFAPLWELEAFNDLIKKYFPEKANN